MVAFMNQSSHRESGLRKRRWWLVVTGSRLCEHYQEERGRKCLAIRNTTWLRAASGDLHMTVNTSLCQLNTPFEIPNRKTAEYYLLLVRAADERK